MEITVLNRQDKIRISGKWVREQARKILRRMKARGDLNIVISDNAFIRKYNRKYHRRNKVTDVLSFHGAGGTVGDIIISAERAGMQAGDYGHSFRDEMFVLVRHGILHLLGYNHKQMKALMAHSSWHIARR